MNKMQTHQINSRKFTLTKESGVASVEFALIALLFLLLTLGLIDVGRGVWAYHSLNQAAREGVRYAIVHGERSANPATMTDIANIVKGKVPNLSEVSVTTTWTPNNSQASTVRVRAQYTYAPIISLLQFTIPMEATAQMAISY